MIADRIERLDPSASNEENQSDRLAIIHGERTPERMRGAARAVLTSRSSKFEIARCTDFSRSILDPRGTRDGSLRQTASKFPAT